MRANLAWHFALAIVCLLLLGANTQVQAFPVGYTYTGSHYTQVTGPAGPG
jgi:hypothetical protein